MKQKNMFMTIVVLVMIGCLFSTADAQTVLVDKKGDVCLYKEINQMTDEVNYTVKIYDSERKAYLIIMYQKNKVFAYIIDLLRMVDTDDNDITIKYRFDSKSTQSIEVWSDNNHLIVVAALGLDPGLLSVLVEQMKSSDILRFQIPIFNRGQNVFKFKLDGFTTIHNKALSLSK